MILISRHPQWEHILSSLFKIATPPLTHTYYVYKGTYGNLVTFPEGVKAGSLTFGKMRCVVIFRLTEIAAAAFHL